MFTTFLIQPIYNGFVFLIGVMPHGDVGLAIIAVTIIIRAVFYPAFASSIRTQMGMAAVQGELDEINKTYKDKADERAKQTFALYKKHGIRPFGSLLALLVQLPVFIALYYSFFRENLPHIATELLYPFVHAPAVVGTNFFGLVNLLTSHNVAFALIVAGTQYGVIRLSTLRMRTPQPLSDAARAARLQQNIMLYMMPLLMGAISFSFPAAVALYFTAGNVISLGQEWIIRRQVAHAK